MAISEFLSGHLDVEISLKKKNGSNVKLSACLSFLPVYTMEGTTLHNPHWQSVMVIFGEELNWNRPNFESLEYGE